MKNPKIQALAKLFEEASHAHHEAFLAVDGADPEWPMWYANHLHKALRELLDPELTQSKIVYELIRLAENPNPGEDPWPIAYAKDLVEKYK